MQGRAGSSVVPLALAVVALLVPSAQATIRPPEADLVVTWAKLAGKRHAFDQPGNRLTVEYVTKNVGRLRSPASHTLIKLEAVGAAHVVKLIAGRVRPLAPR